MRPATPETERITTGIDLGAQALPLPVANEPSTLGPAWADSGRPEGLTEAPASSATPGVDWTIRMQHAWLG